MCLYILLYLYCTTVCLCSISCENMCDILRFLLEHSFLKFGNYIYKQVTGITMGANYAHLEIDSFLL